MVFAVEGPLVQVSLLACGIVVALYVSVIRVGLAAKDARELMVLRVVRSGAFWGADPPLEGEVK